MGIFFNGSPYEDHTKTVRLTHTYSFEEWIVRQKINDRQEAFIGRLLGVMYFDHAEELRPDFFLSENLNFSYMEFLGTLGDKDFFCFAEKIEQLNLKHSDELADAEKITLNRTKSLFKNFGMNFSLAQEDLRKHLKTVMTVVLNQLNTSQLLEHGLVQLKFNDELLSIGQSLEFTNKCEALGLQSRQVAFLLKLPSRTIRDFMSHRDGIPKNVIKNLDSISRDDIERVKSMSSDELIALVK